MGGGDVQLRDLRKRYVLTQVRDDVHGDQPNRDAVGLGEKRRLHPDGGAGALRAAIVYGLAEVAAGLQPCLPAGRPACPTLADLKVCSYGPQWQRPFFV